VVVRNHVATGRERAAIAAVGLDGAAGEMVQVATLHEVVLAAGQFDREITEIAELAAMELHGLAVRHDRTAAARLFEHQPFEPDMGGAAGTQERRFEHGNPRGREVGAGKWPEVKLAVPAVEPPFAGLVQLLEDVDEPKPLVLRVAVVMVRLGEGQLVSCKVKRLHSLVAIAPVESPVAMREDLAAGRPSRGPVAGIDNPAVVPAGGHAVESLFTLQAVDDALLAGLWHIGDEQPAVVGETCESHARMVDEEFQPGRGTWRDGAELGDARGAEVGHQRTGASRCRQPVKDDGAGDGDELSRGAAAAQMHARSRCCAPDHRRGAFAGIFGREFK